MLIASSLLIESFRKVLEVDVGFQPQQLLAVRVDNARSFETLQQALAYYDRLREIVRDVPGVTALGFSDTLPLGRNRSWGFGAAGVSYQPGGNTTASPRMVDPGYLTTLGVPLRSGRQFTESDHADSAHVVMVSESLARQLWPGRDPVGQMLIRPWNLDEPYGRVIGVVADISRELEGDVATDVYFSIRQFRDWASPAQGAGPARVSA